MYLLISQEKNYNALIYNYRINTHHIMWLFFPVLYNIIGSKIKFCSDEKSYNEYIKMHLSSLF